MKPAPAAGPLPELPPEVEFIDIGCGDGRSTQAIRKRLKVRGVSLGIDRSGLRLPQSTPNTVFAERDVLELPNKKQCQFATLVNILPGAASHAAALDLLRKATIISRGFVYVSQPNFDSNAYLLRFGLKTYYADAGANRFQGTSADYYRMARQLMDQGLISDFSIIESGRIRDSADEAIHPLQTPPETGPYDPALHRYKASDIVFAEPIYRRLLIILTRKPSQLVPITKRLRELDGHDNVIVSSSLL